jgi:phosphatidate phosphatase APP1
MMLDKVLHLIRESVSVVKGKQPRRLLSYACISNGESLMLRLRVVRSNSKIKFSKKDSVVSHIFKVIRLFLSRSVSSTQVEILIDGKKHILKSSNRGYIEKTLSVEVKEKKIQMILEGKKKPYEVDVTFINPDSKIVVSDLDDTILKSQATNIYKLIARTLFNPLKKRDSFDGACEYYKKLEDQGYKVMYVSSSTWDLFPMIKAFIYEFGFPLGPIFLQNTRDKKTSDRPHHQKFDYVMELANIVNRGKMILIGDEGQHDPEIYLEISKLHPKLVDKILIRKSWWTNKADSQKHIELASKLETDFRYFKEVSDLV